MRRLPQNSDSDPVACTCRQRRSSETVLIRSCRAPARVHPKHSPAHHTFDHFWLCESDLLLRRNPPSEPGERAGMLACTFHSFGARLLRMFGRDIGIEPTFTILSAEEQTAEIMASAKICATTDSERGVAQIKYHHLVQGISRLRAAGKHRVGHGRMVQI